MSSLPHNGHWSRAKVRRFNCTVVFIHHFGGNYQTSRRHQILVNELGFDAVAFDLSQGSTDSWPLIRTIFQDIARRDFELWSTTWKRKLKDILAEIAGPKILFSFSSPSVAVLRFLAEDQPDDVSAWVADCGPFLDATECISAYYRYQTHIPPLLIPLVAPLGIAMIAGPNYENRVRAWIRDFPATVPILSIRCGDDRLVPPTAIDKLFHANAELNLKTLEIPACAHLEGLKSRPDVYAPVVQEFLTKNSNEMTR